MKRYFVTGLAILLPLAITIWIIDFIVDLLTEPFLGVSEQILAAIGLEEIPFLFLSPHQVITAISKVLILIALVSFIFGIGAIASRFFFKFFMHLGNTILHKIPVVRSVYKTSQELIQTIFSDDNKAFKQVVLVPFPNELSKSIGFLTRDDIGGGKVPVFIPTAPNPTSGYLIMYQPHQVVPIKMAVEDALRYIVSCGVLIDPTSSSVDFSPIEKI